MFESLYHLLPINACVIVFVYTSYMLLWKFWHADMYLHASRRSPWLHGRIWKFTCEGIPSRTSLWICLRSKLSSSEEGRWSCYMSEMGRQSLAVKIVASCLKPGSHHSECLEGCFLLPCLLQNKMFPGEWYALSSQIWLLPSSTGDRRRRLEHKGSHKNYLGCWPEAGWNRLRSVWSGGMTM